MCVPWRGMHQGQEGANADGEQEIPQRDAPDLASCVDDVTCSESCHAFPSSSTDPFPVSAGIMRSSVREWVAPFLRSLICSSLRRFPRSLPLVQKLTTRMKIRGSVVS